MAAPVEKSFEIEKEGLKARVEVLGEFVTRNQLKTNKAFFEKMCKEGCPNYGKHYSCPPGSPSFEDYTKGAGNFLALMFCALPTAKSSENFDEVEKAVYPKIDGIMRRLEKISDTRHIAARTCRLCSVCKRQLNEHCSHLEARRNCTVSVGLDCQDLAEKVFHKPLFWQKGENLEGYTSFICLLPLKDLKQKDALLQAIGKFC